MKKSLVKKLVRMAKDGDPEAIEAMAELLEEVSEIEAVEPAVPAAEPEEVAEAVGEPEVVVETPSGNVVAIDEESFAGILERLDQIISLLTPAAADDDPAEQIAEAVEEAIEASAAAEAAGELPEGVAEIAEIVEEILEPETGDIPEVLSAEGDECGEEEPGLISTKDALHAALRPMRPVLAKMPEKQRYRVCTDIYARLNGKLKRKGIYSNLNDGAPKNPDTSTGFNPRVESGVKVS